MLASALPIISYSCLGIGLDSKAHYYSCPTVYS